MTKPKIIKFKKGGILIYNKRKHIKHTGAYIGFTAGSYHNGKDKGVAHFLEHMLFKGTKNLDKDQLNEKIADIVPDINAVTCKNFTAVNFTRTNQLLEPVLDIVSDMLINTNLTQENMKAEIGVIQEELSRNENFEEDSIDCQAEKTYGKKPSIYAVDIYDQLGTHSSLKNFKLKSLQDFKNKHYNLNNFVSSFTTSLPLCKIKKLIRKYFISRLNYDKNYQKTEILYDVNKKENLNIAITKKNKLSMKISFLLNKTIDETKHDYKYAVLSNYVGGRTITSFFTKKLRDLGLVYNAKTYISKSNNDLLFTFLIDTTKDKFDKVINCLNEAIIKVKNEMITEEKLSQIKNNILYSEDEKQSVDIKRYNSQILRYFVQFGKCDIPLSNKQLKKHLSTITPKIINDLANKLFSPKTPLYITLLGNIDPKDFPSHKELKNMILKG